MIALEYEMTYAETIDGLVSDDGELTPFRYDLALIRSSALGRCHIPAISRVYLWDTVRATDVT